MSALDDGPTREVLIVCRGCGQEYVFTVALEAFYEWKNGKLVQDAFPNLMAAERELFISQMCSPCFDEMMGEDESYEDARDPDFGYRTGMFESPFSRSPQS